MTDKLKVSARVAPDGSPFTLTGREAETILALVSAGAHGITSLEVFRAGWAVRLAAYVCELRKMGVAIRTSREAHHGGSHGRYTLACDVEILSRSDEPGREAA